MQRLAFLLCLLAVCLPSALAGHGTISKTIDLSLKQPWDVPSDLHLVSINADGSVTVRWGEGAPYTAKAGQTFRNPHGHTSMATLVSINEGKDAVVILQHTRFLLSPAQRGIQKTPPKQK